MKDKFMFQTPEDFQREFRERAIILTESIQSELDLGTKHFNRKRELLDTVEKIVECLKTGEVPYVEPAKERERLFSQKQPN